MTTTSRPTFGTQLATLRAELAAEGLAIPVPAPRTVKEALHVARPRYSVPTACLTCGGPLPAGRPAYCSMTCAAARREV